MTLTQREPAVTWISSDLSGRQFEQISRIVYTNSGIKLKSGKEALVRSRLMKRLRALKFGSIDDYMSYIGTDEGASELSHLIDVITTNKTSFFRESQHFTFLRKTVLPGLPDRRIRFWTAACSSGEEPYSLAMVLLDNLPEIQSADVRILATDISLTMLQRAARAVYPKEVLQDLPPGYQQRHFVKIAHSSQMFQIRKPVRDLVQVAWLNLVGNWPMRGPFDVIFCRNVMIYFDKATQEKLVNRFWQLMAPGSYLFVGHSEGLSGISHKFKYVQPAVYRK